MRQSRFTEEQIIARLPTAPIERLQLLRGQIDLTR